MSETPSATVKKSAPLLHLGHPEQHIPFFDPPDTPSPKASSRGIFLFVLLGTVAAFAGQTFEHMGEHAATPDVALPWVLPFALLLGCIAVMPFVAKHFWEKHYHHVAIVLAALVSVYYVFMLKVPGPGGEGFFGDRAGLSIARSFGDYISFIFLLGSLYTVSGGILIRVRRKATPAVNTAMLLTGAVLANVFGTTGAAMLLIRPFIRINKGHIRPFHIVFFIFIVANVGGSLTPIGDPPLFLGYLKGVPFWWVLEHCWPMWLVAVGLLLAVFFVMDTLSHRKDERVREDTEDLGPAVSMYGASNLLLVFAILGGVLVHDNFNGWWEKTLHDHLGSWWVGLVQAVHLTRIPLRELVMVAAIAISLKSTPRRIHVGNVFNFAPIKEVALLFIGIFATMVPALNYLSYHANDPALKEALNTPGQFYYSSGALSSVLDNAPTYVTFLEAEIGKLDKAELEVVRGIVRDPNKSEPKDDDFAKLRQLKAAEYAKNPQMEKEDREMLINTMKNGLVKYHGEKVLHGTLTESQIQVGFLLGNEKLSWYIIAVSLGSVFFGAMTYIGNGPNFMVKSIAEQGAQIDCPSFFGYIFKYSIPILLPILILIWWLFLAGQRH